MKKERQKKIWLGARPIACARFESSVNACARSCVTFQLSISPFTSFRRPPADAAIFHLQSRQKALCIEIRQRSFILFVFSFLFNFFFLFFPPVVHKSVIKVVGCFGSIELRQTHWSSRTENFRCWITSPSTRFGVPWPLGLYLLSPSRPTITPSWRRQIFFRPFFVHLQKFSWVSFRQISLYTNSKNPRIINHSILRIKRLRSNISLMSRFIVIRWSGRANDASRSDQARGCFSVSYVCFVRLGSDGKYGLKFNISNTRL